MTSLANMKSLFPAFSDYFNPPTVHAAVDQIKTKMKSKQKIKLYGALVEHEASRTEAVAIEFKSAMKALLKKCESNGKLSSDQKKKFHKQKEKDKKLEKTKARAFNPPQNPANGPKPDAAPKETDAARRLREQQEHAARALNLQIEQLATRLTFYPTGTSFTDQEVMVQDQFISIALDHLQASKLALIDANLASESDITDMLGTAYNAMIDCAILRLLQTSTINNPLQLDLHTANTSVSLSAMNDFDGIYTALSNLRAQLLNLNPRDYGFLLRKITDTLPDSTPLPAAALQPFRELGALRSSLEQLLRTKSRFAAAFME